MLTWLVDRSYNHGSGGWFGIS